MKTNKMMRIAAVILVAVLLTTCVISGTFAKYTTSASAADQARVAKWGVAITTSSDLFAETYAKTATEDKYSAITNTVAVDTTGTNVVAPGTSGSVNFSISGTPEVAVDVAVVFDVTKDVKIPSGTTVATDTVLDADYTPVVFTLTKQGESEALASGTLAEIETAMEALSGVKEADADLAGTYTLAWAWAIVGNDAADTYLGNVAAGTVTDANTITEINFSFTITVTQID